MRYYVKDLTFCIWIMTSRVINYQKSERSQNISPNYEILCKKIDLMLQFWFGKFHKCHNFINLIITI